MERNRTDNNDDPQMRYELDAVLPTETIHVSPGTNLLVAGPPMSGKRELTLSILAQGANAEEGNIFVSTDHGAEATLADYQTLVAAPNQAALGIVETTESGATMHESFVHSVTSPADLTGIGIGVSEFMQRFNKNGIRQTRFALDSVSTLLSYVDVRTVFKFCHVLTARLESVGYLGVFTLDTGVHDEQAVNTIKQVFDGMVELRERDDGIEVRVIGLDGYRTGWEPYEPNHS
ncbi:MULTISPECIES: ATPase domain-containing protein [unclassified Haladaptatus]|uniref:RAD55 family ATPase n=2 Tax=Haladaptatus TaxID=367188 RepID=UPI0023E80D5B|nr:MULTISPECIES: ATPase domain-containing protein [unclassified Haladaptatus]